LLTVVSVTLKLLPATAVAGGLVRVLTTRSITGVTMLNELLVTAMSPGADAERV
jgi:hypothetical protein